MISLIQLPDNFATGTAAVATDTIAGLNPYTVLVVGVLLAVTVVLFLIQAFHR
jgi:hypothetical protein